MKEKEDLLNFSTFFLLRRVTAILRERKKYISGSHYQEIVDLAIIKSVD